MALPTGVTTSVQEIEQASLSQRVSTVTAAAKKYGVPPAYLIGVWGAETGFGSDVTNSSTGAVGDFQFEPDTAAAIASKGHPYPLTNTPTDAQFAQQADAAAYYLSYLFQTHGGSWNNAIEAYSGGGYGLSHVQDQFQTFKSEFRTIAQSLASATSAATDPANATFNIAGIDTGIPLTHGAVSGAVDAGQAAINAVNSVPKALSLIFSLRGLELLAGLALAAFALLTIIRRS